MDTIASLESQTLESQPGVIENPNGGYHVHVRLNERGTATGSLLGPRASMPPARPSWQRCWCSRTASSWRSKMAMPSCCTSATRR